MILFFLTNNLHRICLDKLVFYTAYLKNNSHLLIKKKRKFGFELLDSLKNK